MMLHADALNFDEKLSARVVEPPGFAEAYEKVFPRQRGHRSLRGMTLSSISQQPMGEEGTLRLTAYSDMPYSVRAVFFPKQDQWFGFLYAFGQRLPRPSNSIVQLIAGALAANVEHWKREELRRLSQAVIMDDGPVDIPPEMFAGVFSSSPEWVEPGEDDQRRFVPIEPQTPSN